MALREHTRRADITFAFAVGLLLYLCWIIRSTLLLLYLSIVFAVIFTPAVAWVQRLRIGSWHPSRGAAVLLLIAAALLALTGLGLLVIPSVTSDLQSFSSELPQRLDHLQHAIAKLPFGERIASTVRPGVIQSHLADWLQRMITSVQALAGGAMDFALLIIMTAYFIVDGNRSFAWVMSLVPDNNRQRLAGALKRAAGRMQQWLVGQALLMLILGSSSLLVFWLLGVHYFYALALFAGLTNFVPIIGPVATVIVAGIVAVLDSWMRLVGVVVFYAVYQQVENSFLTPRIMKSTVKLPAIAVVVALGIGGALAGVAGAIVAVPTAALVATLVDEYLKDHSVDVEERHAA